MLMVYQRLLDTGALWPDASQRAAARMLQQLQESVLLREAGLLSGQWRLPDADKGSGGDESPATATATSSTSGTSNDTASLPKSAAAARGAYLWGPVGSGKTALMDMFARTTRQQLLAMQAAAAAAAAGPGPVAGQGPDTAGPGPGSLREASREHFHEFMQGVHGRLHQLHLARPTVVARSRQGMLVYRYAEPEEDPLVTVARERGRRTAVLCLDELHVTDVADAMILSRLFGELLDAQGTAVVFTSNRQPRDLYKGGLSRKYFQPFIDLVDSHLAVAHVAADVDYRRAAAAAAAAGKVEARAADGSRKGEGAGQVAEQTSEPAAEPATAQQAAGGDTASAALPLGDWNMGPGACDSLRTAWQHRLEAAGSSNSSGGGGSTDTDDNDTGIQQLHLPYGRTIKVPNACGNAAFFTFDQLCGSTGLRAGMDDGGALAAPDYIALCRHFRELYVTGVPQLDPDRRDEARRLVTLLDVAYDNRCRLVVSAAVSPDALFAPLLEDAKRQGINPRLGLHRRATAHSPSPGHKHADAAAVPSAFPAAVNLEKDSVAPVPAASVTAALHMGLGLGPAATQGSGSGLTNSIHPSEFTGGSSANAAAPFAVGPPAKELGPGQPAQGQRQRQGPPRRRPGDLELPRSLLSEEVLMYHRAVSRLAEMCRVVEAAEAGAE